ncbi:hypothetical protein M758_10G156700 [Ceratodon purpureus]|nr:hypothetical protein M758_10G156700 [Ceratodon purpureus]
MLTPSRTMREWLRGTIGRRNVMLHLELSEAVFILEPLRTGSRVLSLWRSNACSRILGTACVYVSRGLRERGSNDARVFSLLLKLRPALREQLVRQCFPCDILHVTWP